MPPVIAYALGTMLGLLALPALGLLVVGALCLWDRLLPSPKSSPRRHLPRPDPCCVYYPACAESGCPMDTP